jgi:hypothetical protein
VSDCPRVGKLFGGCRFRPRYDVVGAAGGVADAFFWGAVSGRNVVPAQPRSTYICDVCETCGKTLVRRKTAA